MSGLNLISVALAVITLSLVLVTINTLLITYQKVEKIHVTEKHLDHAYRSLEDYYTRHNKYPCPSSIEAPIDTPTFGVAASDCGVSSAGITTFLDADGSFVAAGAIPFRTLGLSDEKAFDSYKKRLLYTVSVDYTSDSDTSSRKAGIRILDREGDDVMESGQKAIYTLVAFNTEDRGAYSTNGALLSSCGDGGSADFFSKNCDNDNIFVHSPKTVDEGDDKYVSKLRFKSERACANTRTTPEKVAILLDSSMSMTKQLTKDGQKVCPEAIKKIAGGNCSKLDMAMWILNRVMFQRIHQVSDVEDSTTGFANFPMLKYDWKGGKSMSRTKLQTKMNERGVEVSDEKDVVKLLYTICPILGTPIGEYLEEMVHRIGDGTPDNPNVITIITDGKHTSKKKNPNDVAKYVVKPNYPNLRVNVIDLESVSGIRKTAEITGGKYVQVSDLNSFLEELTESIGGCAGSSETTIPDQPYCQKVEDLIFE